MASKIKVNEIETVDGTGSITVNQPLSGSGAGLTSLPAANLTGSLPAISGASLTGILPAVGTSGNVLTSTGSAWASTAVASSFGDSFRATLTSQNVPNNTLTLIEFSVEAFDTGSKYNNSTYRYTPAAGKYLLTARVSMAAKNDQHHIIVIKKNGTHHSQGAITTYDSNSGGDAHVMNLITIVDSNVTDYWEVWYTHQWGATWGIDGSTGANEFSGVRIG